MGSVLHKPEAGHLLVRKKTTPLISTGELLPPEVAFVWAEASEPGIARSDVCWVVGANKLGWKMPRIAKNFEMLAGVFPE